MKAREYNLAKRPDEVDQALKDFDSAIENINHYVGVAIGKAALVDIIWREASTASEDEPKPDTCAWVKGSENYHGQCIWLTSCSKQYGWLDDRPEALKVGYKYCPNCGRPIETNDEG